MHVICEVEDYVTRVRSISRARPLGRTASDSRSNRSRSSPWFPMRIPSMWVNVVEFPASGRRCERMDVTDADRLPANLWPDYCIKAHSHRKVSCFEVESSCRTSPTSIRVES